MSTGAGARRVATEKTQLFAPAVVVFADVGAWGECDKFMWRAVKQIMSLFQPSVSLIPEGCCLSWLVKVFISVCEGLF